MGSLSVQRYLRARGPPHPHGQVAHAWHSESQAESPRHPHSFQQVQKQKDSLFCGQVKSQLDALLGTLLRTFSGSTCKVDATFGKGPASAGLLLGFRPLYLPYRAPLGHSEESHSGESRPCPCSRERKGAWAVLLITSNVFCSTHFSS